MKKPSSSKPRWRLPDPDSRLIFKVDCPACGRELMTNELVALRAKRNPEIEYAVCCWCARNGKEPPHQGRVKKIKGEPLPFPEE